LVRGGAFELVQKLDETLQREGIAYTTVGDDSWVAAEKDGDIYQFDLDASNFDLTQEASVSLPVHQAVRSQLAKIDKTAADLWYAYARKRQVVVAQRVVRRWKHGGPSGFPLQSLVNDMLEQILCNRVKERMQNMPVWSRETIGATVETVGKEMGFSMRMEQFTITKGASTLVQALVKDPFLFIGYKFHATEMGMVYVHCDLPRQMSQLPYPGTKWMQKGLTYEVLEAMRLGSTIMNWGIPSPRLRDAFARARYHAQHTLRRVIKQFGDTSDEKLRWVVGELPQGANTAPSLSGLLEALEQPAGELWLVPKVADDLGGTSELVTNWADDTDEAEEEERRLHRVEAPMGPDPTAMAVKPAVLVGDAARPSHPLTHPVTRANDGRNAPTARWAPDKPKKERTLQGYRAHEAVARHGQILPGDLEQFLRYQTMYGNDDEVDEEGWDELSQPESITLSEYEEQMNDSWFHDAPVAAHGPTRKRRS
jgi:hypothetical protein